VVEPERLHSADGITWRTRGPALEPEHFVRIPKDVPEGIGSRRLTDINQPRHMPFIPKEYNVAGRVYVGLFDVCVSRRGTVELVRIVQSTGERSIDEAWISKIEDWRYEPFRPVGINVPFCHPLRLEIRSRS
jgi:hypothetical protein